MLLTGLGLPMDRRAAFACFLTAASAGNAEAQNLVGRCYENGWGVAMDRDAARLSYRRAAELGDYRGAHNHACVLAAEGCLAGALHWFTRGIGDAPEPERSQMLECCNAASALRHPRLRPPRGGKRSGCTHRLICLGCGRYTRTKDHGPHCRPPRLEGNRCQAVGDGFRPAGFLPAGPGVQTHIHQPFRPRRPRLCRPSCRPAPKAPGSDRPMPPVPGTGACRHLCCASRRPPCWPASLSRRGFHRRSGFRRRLRQSLCLAEPRATAPLIANSLRTRPPCRDQHASGARFPIRSP